MQLPLPPQDQRHRDDRSKGAKRGLEHDLPNLAAGRQPGELLPEERQLVKDLREVIADFGLLTDAGQAGAWEWLPGRWCLLVMDGASHYRERADHVRQLAEAAWQDDLKETLRRLARDFDDIAEDIEAGATEPRRPELLP